MTPFTFTNRSIAKKFKAIHASPRSTEKKSVASIILGGGEGIRLYPLTLTRCKPAINFGGKYRLIDVPISNSIHANCEKVFILTQFLSSSLHHHIFQTYMQGGKVSEMIEVLTAEQKPNQKSWFQGTADAVRQNLDYFLETPVDYFLVLSGDQLYNIDFQEMMHFAKRTDADVIVAALPVTAEEASRLGILKVNAYHFITDFHEKPKDIHVLESLRSPDSILEQVGLSPESPRQYLGSMGIYLFKREALVKLLRDDLREDFGKHLLPTQLKKGSLAAFLYDGYWEDVGTIETFYQANMALLHPYPQFSFYHEQRPIFTTRYNLPPAKFIDSQIKRSLLCEGTIVGADEVSHSILGPRSVIHKGAIIRDSYVMGNDYYDFPIKDHERLAPHPHIGEDSILVKTIVDKNASIGKGVRLINKQQLDDYNGENIFIRNGVIVVPRGARIPDGFIL